MSHVKGEGPQCWLLNPVEVRTDCLEDCDCFTGRASSTQDVPGRNAREIAINIARGTKDSNGTKSSS